MPMGSKVGRASTTAIDIDSTIRFIVSGVKLLSFSTTWPSRVLDFQRVCINYSLVICLYRYNCTYNRNKVNSLVQIKLSKNYDVGKVEMEREYIKIFVLVLHYWLYRGSSKYFSLVICNSCR